jgi:hypothetical protein
MPIDGGISGIVYIAFSIAQVILGSISVYSLFNDAVFVGFACMIILYTLGFIKSHAFKKAPNCS